MHTCRYLEYDPGPPSVCRCDHPQIHAKRGVVTANVCRLCEFAAPPAANRARQQPIPRRAASGAVKTGHSAKQTLPPTSAPSVSILARRAAGRVLLGRTEISPGEREVHACDVVIPYFKGLHWLAGAIESILSQNCVRSHLHLINDNSPEDDRSIRKRFRRFENLHWYRNRETIGPFAAVNGVFAELKTDFLVLQDADDVSLPNRLWRSIQALQVTNCDIYGGAMEQFIDPTMAAAPVHARYLDRSPILRSGGSSPFSPLGHVVNGTMTCRRSVFQGLNGFADLRSGADSEFVARAHLAGIRMFMDEATVGLRRMHDFSLSRCGAFAAGTDYHQQVNAFMADVQRQFPSGGTAFALRRFGALDKHCAEQPCVRIRTVKTTLDPCPAIRLLADLDSHSTAFAYLAGQKLLGAKPGLTAAVLPLERFSTFKDFFATLSPNVRRDAKLATKHRYACREFIPANHFQDILAIVQSQPQRQGRAVRDTISASIEQDQRDPQQRTELAPIANPTAFSRWFGIFAPCGDQLQDAPHTNEKLLAFISLRRYEEIAVYSRIMGHGDYLRCGIMFALHIHVMKWLLDRGIDATRGLRYILYSAWEDGQDSLRLWKQRAGFKPHCFYASDQVAAKKTDRVPEAFPMQVLPGAKSAAAFFCAAFGGRSDVIHYHHAGITDVTLIDNDVDKMGSLRERFTTAWRYCVGDAFSVAAALTCERSYDVVSCDQWSSQFELVASKHFKTFYNLANRHLLISVVPFWADAKGCNRQQWFTENGHNYSFYVMIRDLFTGNNIPYHLSRRLSMHVGFPVRVVDIIRRSKYLGGCYWIVIDKERQL